MLKKVKAYIRKHDLFHQGDSVIVGVSGGADSMALLMCLNAMKEELGLTLFVAHVNHGLRGKESDEDGDMVAQTATKLNLPFYVKQCDCGVIAGTAGQSLEDAARKIRYDFFFQLLSNIPADRIALGHQFHDQAETVLLNLLRGAGTQGMRGILPQRDQIVVRPLLDVRREEILFFLQKENISYREDATNRSTVFLRNRVRHELIPCLQYYNQRIEERLCNLGNVMRIEHDFLEGQVHHIFDQWGVDPASDPVTLAIDQFNMLHEALQRRIIKVILEHRSTGRNGIHQIHIETMLNLIRDSHVGQKLSLPFFTEVVRRYDQIIFGQKQKSSATGFIETSPKEATEWSSDKIKIIMEATKFPATVSLGKDRPRVCLNLREPPEMPSMNSPSAFIDYDKILYPLIIRNMKPGDRFRPLGMKGTKKLKSFFIDRKIPQEIRGDIPLLVDREKILWVGGLCISDDAKVTDQTRRCLKIEII